MNDYFLSKKIFTEGYDTMKILRNVLRILFFLLLIMSIISVVFDFYCKDIIVLIYAFVTFVLGTIIFLNILKK